MSEPFSVGKLDAFEREYTGKFRSFAAEFGEFVSYERDRAARDIGLHLTEKTQTGSERMSSSLCWFQLKGIQKTTLTKDDLRGKETVGISLRVDHLVFWYQLPTPTYIVLYLECVDQFYVLNIQKYIEDKWGPSIAHVNTKTATIQINLSSILDDQAFRLILRKGQVDSWRKLFNLTNDEVHQCQRDFELIYQLGTAASRSVQIQLHFIDWISKTRSELYFKEYAVDHDTDPVELRSHWQYMMSMGDLEDAYPYLDFEPLSEDGEEDYWDDSGIRHIEFERSGCTIIGEECGGEYEIFELAVSLNELGKKLYGIVSELIGSKMIEIANSSNISVAPWHARDV